jgi:hypothetical protein
MHLINGRGIFLDSGEDSSNSKLSKNNILFLFKKIWQKQQKQSVENDMKNSLQNFRSSNRTNFLRCWSRSQKQKSCEISQKTLTIKMHWKRKI